MSGARESRVGEAGGYQGSRDGDAMPSDRRAQELAIESVAVTSGRDSA